LPAKRAQHGCPAALETDAQLAEAGEPGMGSLDRPAMPAQAVAAFDAFAGNACRHASLSQVTTAPRVIVALVGVELAGPLSWSASNPGTGGMASIVLSNAICTDVSARNKKGLRLSPKSLILLVGLPGVEPGTNGL